MELVSVIVAVYNQEKYIRELLDSICGQSYSELQILLVDDGSSDNSLTICNEYSKKDKRITVVHKENGGVSSARNAGLAQATGKYVFVLDGDDIPDKDYCLEMVQMQEKYPDSFVLCGYEEFDGENGRFVLSAPKEDTVIMYSRNELADLVNGTFIHIPWNKIYEQSIINEFGLCYDEVVSNSEDYIFNMQYLEKKNPAGLVMINKPLYRYRKHGSTTLSGRYYEDMFETKKNEVALLARLEEKWEIPHSFGFYKRGLHCLETAILNFMRPENSMPYREKVKICNEVMRSAEYKMYLEKCAGKMSRLRYAVCKRGSASLFCKYIACCRARRK